MVRRGPVGCAKKVGPGCNQGLGTRQRLMVYGLSFLLNDKVVLSPSYIVAVTQHSFFFFCSLKGKTKTNDVK